MQRISGAVLTLALVSLVVACGSGSGHNTSSVVVTSINTGSTRGLLDLAYSPGGITYVSTDFTSQAGPSVLRSTNQGRTWEQLDTGTRPPLALLWAIDDSTVLAANRAVYRSTDQAVTWSISAFNEEDGIGVRDLYFVNTNEAVLSKGGSIYYSADGGRTWQEVYYDAVLGAADCERFSFADQQTGYCAGGAFWTDPWGGTNNGKVLKTVDGGKTWTDLGLYAKLRMAAITGVHFVSPTTGMIFTMNREMFKTTDGGVTWNLVSSNVPASYAYPFFLDERTGVLATLEFGDTSAIYETPDGGTTWRKVFAAPSAISKLRIVNKTTAFFVGRNGMLGKIVLQL